MSDNRLANMFRAYYLMSIIKSLAKFGFTLIGLFIITELAGVTFNSLEMFGLTALILFILGFIKDIKGLLFSKSIADKMNVTIVDNKNDLGKAIKENQENQDG